MYKNKIIAISGEPVSGKGTTVKSLVNELEKNGYKKENIHIRTVGHEFRELFKYLLDFINNFDNEEKINEFSENDILKEFFSVKENREAFIETIKQLKEKNIDLSNIFIEQANNMLEFVGIREIVDKIVDGKTKDMRNEINKTPRPDEIWIIDSRLAFANIPEAFSVRLTCRPEIAGRRLFEDTTRGKEDSKYTSEENAIKQREARRIGEIERYKEIYGIDLSSEDNYDMIIDTSYSKVEDISSTIVRGLEAYVKDEYVAKKWASPRVFLPTQSVRDTWLGVTEPIEKIEESIKNNGYDMKREIDIIEVDGIKYLINGHHRNYAAALLGETLIPYVEIGKDDEQMLDRRCTAREFSKTVQKTYLWDHEGIFDKDDARFSYNEIYPNIYKIIENRENIR